MTQTLLTDDPYQAAQVLQKGGLVVFPTETVYGLGGNALDESVCRRIYTLKNRPTDNPLIIHLSDLQQFSQYAQIDTAIMEIIAALIPGPISFICQKKEKRIFSSGLQTIALRIPDHDLTRKFLQICQLPVAAPSANISGKPSITRYEHAVQQFQGRVDCILKGKEPQIGIESSVIDLTCQPPLLLRRGGMSFEDLNRLFPMIAVVDKAEMYTTPPSPGMKYRHYSPQGQVVLVNELPDLVDGFTARIGFSVSNISSFDKQVENNQQYMQQLYAFFIECDGGNIQKIFCQKPLQDQWAAVLLDRIQKAAGQVFLERK